MKILLPTVQYVKVIELMLQPVLAHLELMMMVFQNIVYSVYITVVYVQEQILVTVPHV